MERPISQRATPGDAAKRRALNPGDNPLVRAVGRFPAKVHTKLLVAFVATALLVVAVGVLGVRLLGQSNERVESLGELQRRSAEYSELRSDAGHVRLLLSGNVAGASTRSSRSPIETPATGPWISRRWTCSTRSRPRCIPRTSGSCLLPRTSSTSGGSARRAPTC